MSRGATPLQSTTIRSTAPARALFACVVLALGLGAAACGKSGAAPSGNTTGTGTNGSDASAAGLDGAAGADAASGMDGTPGTDGGADAPSWQTFQAADTVIGQPDFTTSGSPSATGAATTDSPLGSAAFDGTRLFTPDTYTNRVLGFATVPVTNGAAASLVLGQSSLTTNVAATTPAGAYLPQSLHTDGTTLAIADSGNHRVLLLPTSSMSGAAASVLGGWPDASSPSEGCAADRLRSPAAAFIAGGKLLVADRGNNRVLVWNSVPTASGVAADLVLGQANLTSCVSNDSTQTGSVGVRSAATLSSPTDVWTDGARVLIVDRDNNRVLVWSTFPTTSGAAADLVIGQTAFNLARDAASSSGLYQPGAVAFGGGKLFVADAGHNRVLGWTGIPTSNGAAADVVIGQGSFTLSAPNDDTQAGGDGGATPTARTLSFPTGVALARSALVVSDTLNQRVLVYRAH